MTERRTYIARARVKMWWLTGLAFVLGLVMLFIRPSLPGVLAEPFRDVGIAFIIASLVTAVYEAYARERAAAESMEQVLERIVGDIVDTDIWHEMREQILDKVAVRKQARLRLRLSGHDKLPQNQFVLWTEFTYRLANLRSHSRTELDVLHFLDAFMSDEHTGLPRFLRVEVDGTPQAPDASGTRFASKVSLNERGGRSIPVLIEREEVVYFPGAYNFIMSELTELESVTLESAPPEVHVVVNCMFKEHALDMRNGMTWGHYLLPGQSLEIRFVREPATGPVT